MKKILDEGLLRSDFTFGFELEAFVSEGSDLMDEVRNSDDEYDYITDFLNSFFSKNGMTSLKVVARTHRDGSLSDETGLPFEYSSNIYQVTPQNIEGLIKSLNEILNEGVFTNETCGFHHHLKFNGITERDTVWIYCNMAMDPNWDEFSNFKSENGDNISLFNDDYASYQDLDDLSAAIENGNFGDVAQYLTTSKYRAFRIHPQGTLEWRGPRDFLSSGNRKDIKNFYFLLLRLIDRIKKYMDSNVLIGTEYTKKEFFNFLSEAIKEKNLSPSLEFINGYDQNLSNIKSEKSSMPFREEIENKLTDIFTEHPEKFYKFLIKDNKGIRKYLRGFVSGLSILNTLIQIIKKTLELDNKSIDKEKFVYKLIDELSSMMDMDMVINQLAKETPALKYLSEKELNKIYDEYPKTVSGVINITKHFIKNNVKIKLSKLYNAIVKNLHGIVYHSIYELLLEHAKGFLSDKQIYKIIISLLMNEKNTPNDIIPNGINRLVDELITNLPEKLDEYNSVIINRAIKDGDIALYLYCGEISDRHLYTLLTNIPHEKWNEFPRHIKEKIEKMNLM